MGKIFEKILCRRIRWHFLPKSNARQYGFVPQRSTEDALYDLVQRVRGILHKKEIALIVSLDIEGAFDNAWWPAIKCRMIEKRISVNLRRLVEDYFRDRSVVVRYAGGTVRNFVDIKVDGVRGTVVKKNILKERCCSVKSLY